MCCSNSVGSEIFNLFSKKHTRKGIKMGLNRQTQCNAWVRCVLPIFFLCWPMIGYAAEPDISDIELLISCAECHEDTHQLMSSTRHWGLKTGGATGIDAPCVRCHGPDIEHSMAEQSSLIAFSQPAGQGVQTGNEICLGCHKNNRLLHWSGSAHESDDVACVGCHVVHKEDGVLEKKKEAKVCFRCHQTVRGEFLKPYNHPIREEKLTCSDCHQSHGGNGPSELKGFTVNESCVGCHPELRGPFLWEHQPVSESCTLCHNAHGSIQPAMLLARGPHLCQLCHQPTSEMNARHARLALGYSDPDSGIPGPGGGGAGISRFVLSSNCMNCHVQVHGSNHPSGVMLER